MVQPGELSLKIQIENAIVQAIQTYFNIVQQQQLVKSLSEEIAVSEEREKIADRKFTNGSGGKLDLLQANKTAAGMIIKRAFFIIVLFD